MGKMKSLYFDIAEVLGVEIDEFEIVGQSKTKNGFTIVTIGLDKEVTRLEYKGGKVKILSDTPSLAQRYHEMDTAMLYKNLKKVLSEAGHTSSAIAKITGLGIGTVESYLYGARTVKPKIETAIKICNSLNKKLSELLLKGDIKL